MPPMNRKRTRCFSFFFVLQSMKKVFVSLEIGSNDLKIHVSGVKLNGSTSKDQKNVFFYEIHKKDPIMVQIFCVVFIIILLIVCFCMNKIE